MRISVSLADIGVELDDVVNPTIDGVETLLNRAVTAALIAYKGLAEVDGLVLLDEDEEESATPEED